jgi:hypothetical protein
MGAVTTSKEVDMFRYQRVVLTAIVVVASFVPAANAMAGLLSNHNETLLLDD